MKVLYGIFRFFSFTKRSQFALGSEWSYLSLFVTGKCLAKMSSSLLLNSLSVDLDTSDIATANFIWHKYA